MPRHSAFKWAFRCLHRCRIWLGGRDAHVGRVRQEWSLLYRVLNEHVARNALRVARHEGVEAIVCGHTHAAMAIERQGRCYFQHRCLDRKTPSLSRSSPGPHGPAHIRGRL